MLIADIDHSLEDLPRDQGSWEQFTGVASLDTRGNTGFQDPTKPNMHTIECFDEEAITVPIKTFCSKNRRQHDT
jgi:hypothetical protein